MLDSASPSELNIDPSSLSSVNAERGSAERTPRSAIHGFQDVERSSAEHVSALLKMGVLKQEAGGYPEAEDLFQRAVELGERVIGPENPALATGLMKLAGARILCGRPETAESLVIRALSLTEKDVGENDQDHVILVNDLARLCLKQSAHGIAEPLLLRLLAMKRSKGDDHPEVATVLASLATVRQALGRHESAEQLWRRVLDIRERTLAPNHLGLATALERLADSCSARGKIGEALQLLQRALTIRELTLGTGNPSLRVSRDRIADLQLQASEDSLDASALETTPAAPERYRLLAADHSTQSSSRPGQERSVAKVRIERAATEPNKAAALPPLIEVARAEEEIPRPLPLAIEHVLDSSPSDLADEEVIAEDFESGSDLVNYQDVILSIRQELEEDENASPAPVDRLKSAMGAMVEALRQRQKETAITVGALALVAGLATASQALIKSQQAAPAQETSALRGSGQASEPPATQAVSRPADLAADREKSPAVASAASIPVGASSRPRVIEQRTPTRRAADRRDATAIAIPSMSSSVMVGLDSIVRSRLPAARAVSEPVEAAPSPPPVVTAVASRVSFAPEPVVVAPQRARLIGKLPAPHYPEQLLDVEGDVRVRFQVDASGRPVMSTLSVLSSSNEFFTAAVFKVIRGLRFEPALSGGADSKPTTDVVQLGFAFRPSK